MENNKPSNLPSFRKPTWLVVVVSTALVGVAIGIRFGLWNDHFVPIGYAVPLLAFLWLRDRRFLWIVAGCFWVMTWYKLFFFLEGPAREHRYTSLGFQTADLILVALIIHYVITARRGLEERNVALGIANEEMARREEEIARQNEELQSQTEELERQSEELRITNDELAGRERTLEHMLALSRALATSLQRSEIMSAVCEALGFLMNHRAPAAAIVERRGDRVYVACHHGFGPEGLEAESVPLADSFAALVLSRAQTAYIEDIDLRPDLKISQPKNGPRMRSILATPLRVKGKPVGALEVYSAEPRTWSEEHVALLESLAAQTSVSLEAAELVADVQQERNRLSAVMETVPFGVYITNPDMTDVHLNPTGAAMFSVPVETNLADPKVQAKFTMLKNGVPLKLEEHPLMHALHQQETVPAEELELVSPGGKRMMVLTSAAPIIDRSGKLLGAVAAFADITTQKQLQHELDRRRREAEEASVRKTRFLAAVSHDIRTPANAINLLAELIRRTAANPAMLKEIPKLAEEMQGSAGSLVNLVSDVLDLTRFDSGRIELNESEFSLTEAVVTEVRQMQPVAQEKGLMIDLEAPAQPIRVRTDRIKLARVIGNLLGNALKFTQAGEVRVRVAVGSDRRAFVHVSDTGVGIEPENLDRIFDEFFQLRNPERDSTKGTGLGLTICKRLVDAMGGELLVESTPGRGSTFTVALPASSVVAQSGGEGRMVSIASNAMPSNDGPIDGGAPDALRNVRILLVEDHDATRRSTSQLLASRGATVAEAPDGRTALRLLKEFGPDVLLLDMMLPDMNGRDILRRLAERRPASLKRVLVLTGDTTSLDASAARLLGADELIHKPIDLAALVRKVHVNVDGEARNH